MTIDFVTSDTHFGHANVIKHDNRPFTDVDTMDEEMIDRWNAKVQNRNKHVWHLGDFCYRNKRSIDWYTQRLFGHIHIVLGNHDDRGPKRHPSLFASVSGYEYLKQDNFKINLFHYSCRTWRSAHHGAWLLFGHSHGRLKPYGKSFDVGTMNHGYAPLSFAEIRDIINNLPAECADRAVRSAALEDDDSPPTDPVVSSNALFVERAGRVS